MKKKILVIVALLTVYVVWGSTFLGIRVGLEGGFPPLLFIGLRFLLAGGLLYGLSAWNGEVRSSWTEWRESVLLGFLLLVCGPGLVAWSEKWISSSLAALLVATSPVWITLLDGKEKLTRLRWLGILTGLGGVFWLVGASVSLNDGGVLLGCAACLASALAWAVGSLRARRRSSAHGWLVQSGQQMLAAGALLVILGFAGGETVSLTALESQAWLALGYLTVFGSLVAFSAYTWLAREISSLALSSHAYINPIVAVFLGVVVGGESLSPGVGTGALLGLLGVVLMLIPDQSKIFKGDKVKSRWTAV